MCFGLAIRESRPVLRKYTFPALHHYLVSGIFELFCTWKPSTLIVPGFTVYRGYRLGCCIIKIPIRLIEVVQIIIFWRYIQKFRWVGEFEYKLLDIFFDIGESPFRFLNSNEFLWRWLWSMPMRKNYDKASKVWGNGDFRRQNQKRRVDGIDKVAPKQQSISFHICSLGNPELHGNPMWFPTRHQ